MEKNRLIMFKSHTLPGLNPNLVPVSTQPSTTGLQVIGEVFTVGGEALRCFLQHTHIA